MIDIEYFKYVDQTLKTKSDRYFDTNLNLLIVLICQTLLYYFIYQVNKTAAAAANRLTEAVTKKSNKARPIRR